MSLLAAMNTAISGLGAQSDAFGNISDNVANSQTVGYKRADTAFTDFLTSSSASNNNPGSVVAKPTYRNAVQGTIGQSDNPLSMAITGQGLFAVSRQNGTASGAVTFSTQNYYTRVGDFGMDKNGYVVNSAGDFLKGWAVNSTTGVINRTTMAPIQITKTVYNPVATSEVTLSANLPATPASGSTQTAQVDVYDALGTPHTVTLNWTLTSANLWSVAVESGDDVTATARGIANVTFGATSGNPVAEGTIGLVGSGSGSVVPGSYVAGAAATLTFDTDFGQGAQTITLNLGSYGGSSGVTQYAGTSFALRGITQDGVPPGSFSSVTTNQSGDIQVNYDNGQARVIARAPVVTFNNPNELQRQDGQAFTATNGSGAALAQDAGSNGAGGLVVQSVEQSNVDIASEFSKLIVAQRAYSANTKMVTTAYELLQQTIDMKR